MLINIYFCQIHVGVLLPFTGHLFLSNERVFLQYLHTDYFLSRWNEFVLLFCCCFSTVSCGFVVAVYLLIYISILVSFCLLDAFNCTAVFFFVFFLVLFSACLLILSRIGSNCCSSFCFSLLAFFIRIFFYTFWPRMSSSKIHPLLHAPESFFNFETYASKLSEGVENIAFINIAFVLPTKH